MEISAKDVMKLRQMTSAGMMDCKKALIEAEGDFTKAVDIIREKGKLVAAKRADRETSEGAVVVRQAAGKAIIVCLGCETDFVSATPEFKALAAEIADAAKSIELIMNVLCAAIQEGLDERKLEKEKEAAEQPVAEEKAAVKELRERRGAEAGDVEAEDAAQGETAA